MFPSSLSKDNYRIMTQSPARSASVASSEVTALSVEFVATPRGALDVQTTIPAAITNAMKEITGFAGCVVMVAEQEARLVTVITFWSGPDRVKNCSDNARWVYQLLVPYLDRCLRVQTLVAHLPFLPHLQQSAPTLDAARASRANNDDDDACFAQ